MRTLFIAVLVVHGIVLPSVTWGELPPLYCSQWGSYGTESGQFNFAWGIALDVDGYVYVADGGNNRIQKFTSGGCYIAQWGSLGTGPGQFKNPCGIAVDADGRVYVSDYFNNRIQKFTSKGDYLTEWGTSGTEPGMFSNPCGIAVDASGHVYVADVVNNRIQKFTSSGDYITQWGGFNHPMGVAVDASGHVYVADTNNDRIQQFTSNGGYLATWGGSGSGMFDQPYGVSVDDAGHVYITDTGNNRIQEFTSSGEYLTQWGTYGTGEGQFNTPQGGVAVRTGLNVYVADYANHRIQKFCYSASLCHIGDDSEPPCFGTEVPSVGPYIDIPLVFTSDDIEDYRETGASIAFNYYGSVSAQGIQLSLNGNALPSPAASPDCNGLEYMEPVTTKVVTGTNILHIAAAGTGELEDFVLGLVSIIPSVKTDDISVIVSTARNIVTFMVRKDELPYDQVKIVIFDDGQKIMFGEVTDGTKSFNIERSGEYEYQILEAQIEGAVIDEGSFTINLENKPPTILEVDSEPDTISNSGLQTAIISVSAADSDGVINGVYIDLCQIGGSNSVQMQNTGGSYCSTVNAGDSISEGLYSLPVYAVDDLASRTDTTALVYIRETDGLDETTLNICGFLIKAGVIEEISDNEYLANGNVYLTHESGLSLLVGAGGGIRINYNTPAIYSDGEVTVKVDLGDLGIYELFNGNFTINVESELSIDQAANYLLQEVKQYILDTDTMEIELVLDEDPGIQISSSILMDEIDGIPGNDEPSAQVSVILRSSGSVSGNLSSDEGDIHWNIAAGELTFASADWENEVITVSNAFFEFQPGLFDADIPAVSVPLLTITQDGIVADEVIIDDFDFSYGGFSFSVVEAGISNSCFHIGTACVAFPLQTGSFESCVCGLEIRDGQIYFSGGEIQVPPLKIGTYSLSEAYAHFASDEYGRLILSAEGELFIPNLAKIGIAFDLDSDCRYLLKSFCMAAKFRGKGIPIGNTGMLLTDIGGCIDDKLCKNEWIIRFTASMSSMDRIDPPGISLIQSDVFARLETVPLSLAAEGTVFLIGYRLGAAGFELYPSAFHGWGRLEFPPDMVVLRASTDLNVNWVPSFNFLGTGNGTLTLPGEKIPFWWQDVQLSEFSCELDPEGISGELFIPDRQNPILTGLIEFAWDGTFNVGFNTQFPILFLDTQTASSHGVIKYVREPNNQTQKTIVKSGSSQGYTEENSCHATQVLMRKDRHNWINPANISDVASTYMTFTDTTETRYIYPESGPVLFHLSEEPQNTGVELEMNVISPSLSIIDSAFCDTHEGYYYAKSTDHILLRIDEPETGTWQVVISEIDTDEEYILEMYSINSAPSINIITPSQNISGSTDDQYQIIWDAVDPDGDDISVYIYAIDENDAGQSWIIADEVSPTDTSITWLPGYMPDGTYSIVAKVSDPYHQAVCDTSLVTISLGNTEPPSRPLDVEIRPGPEKLKISWDADPEYDIMGYRLFWQRIGSTVIDTIHVGNNSQYILSSLRNFEDYNVWLEAYDVMDHSSLASDIVTAHPDPLGDVDAPAIPSDIACIYDQARNVVTVQWTQSDDAVGYRIYYDFDVIGKYTGIGALEGDSPVWQNRTGSITLNALQGGRMYYIGISSVDAAGNESLISDPVSILVSDPDDSDGDGLPDEWEYQYFRSLDFGAQDDPDQDMLTDEVELTITRTNPAEEDSDGDHVKDGADPNPLKNIDLDYDGMSDDWELVHGASDPTEDLDNDLLPNAREFSEYCWPRDYDTDDDGLSDGFEADSIGTDGWNPDTDGGGLWDYWEVYYGMDPLNPDDDNDIPTTGGDKDHTPAVTMMGSPYPNPFNATLTIPFDISSTDHVRIDIYNVQGQLIKKLVDERRVAGRWYSYWNGKDNNGASVSSGIYFVRFVTGEYSITRKIVILR